MLERVLRNWPLKLLALGLAVFIWLAVAGENRVVNDIQVPLEVVLPTELTLSDPPPAAVSVRLSGPESLVERVGPLGVAARVDLRDASPGERSVQLSASDVLGIPVGIDVTRIDPDRLALVIDRKLRRFVPVVPSLNGSPPEGYAFYGARVVPDRLEIEGPERDVAATERLRTDPVSLETRTEPFQESVGAVPENSRIVVVDPRSIVVRADVDIEPVDRGFRDVPVVLAGASWDTTANPSQLRVTVSGPPSLVEALKPAQLRAVADVSGLEPGESPYRVTVRVELTDVPADELGRLTVRDVSREKISVTVRPGRRRN